MFKSESMVQFHFLRDIIQTTISADQNGKLNEIPDREEIFEALKSLHLTKASGPNRMSALFFQHF